MLRSLTNHPKRGVALALVLLLGGLFVFPHVAHAGDPVGDAVVYVLNGILSAVVFILGTLLVKFIDVLIWIFQFNNFINAPAVTVGWTVTRDVANMFFIVALLLIAIGTVFRIQEYRYTRMLQKLIIMAILINFSKLIAGFFIDLSQVVMLTFVNAFKDMAAGNLTTGFGLQNVVSLSQNASAAAGQVNYWSILGAMFAAVVMLFVAIVVVGVFVVVLIQRIIMLWIYIVLSPTAYMVAVLPGSLGSWWSSWWRDFSQYLIRGPVIAFFMWLALTIISLSNQQTNLLSTSSPNDTTSTAAPTLTGNDLPAFASQATTSNAIISYILAVGMLIAALQQATKVGGAAGAVAGKWMGNLNKAGGAIAMAPLKGTQAVLRRPAYAAAGGALSFASKIPLVGGFARNANAKLRKSRVKLEEKDSDLVNYMSLDEKMKTLNSVGNPLSMKGVGMKRNIRENILKGSDFGKLSSGERQKLHNDAQKDAGMSWYKNDEDKVKPIYKDNALGKAVEDASTACGDVRSEKYVRLCQRQMEGILAFRKGRQ